MVVVDDRHDPSVVGGHGAHVGAWQPSVARSPVPPTLREEEVEHLVRVRGRVRDRVRVRGRVRVEVRDRVRVRAGRAPGRRAHGCWEETPWPVPTPSAGCEHGHCY